MNGGAVVDVCAVGTLVIGYQLLADKRSEVSAGAVPAASLIHRRRDPSHYIKIWIGHDGACLQLLELARRWTLDVGRWTLSDGSH